VNFYRPDGFPMKQEAVVHRRESIEIQCANKVLRHKIALAIVENHKGFHSLLGLFLAEATNRSPRADDPGASGAMGFQSASSALRGDLFLLVLVVRPEKFGHS